MTTELKVPDEAIPRDQITFTLEYQEMIHFVLETERTEAALKTV